MHIVVTKRGNIHVVANASVADKLARAEAKVARAPSTWPTCSRLAFERLQRPKPSGLRPSTRSCASVATRPRAGLTRLASRVVRVAVPSCTVKR